MRPRLAAIAALVVAALTLGLIGSAGIASASDDQKRKKAVDARIRSIQQDLDGLSAAMAKATGALQSARAKLAAAQSRVATLRGQLAAAQARQRQLAEQLRVAEAEVAQAQRAIDATNARMAATHAQLGRMARADYQSGDSGTLEVLLDAQTPAEVADRIVLARSAMQSQTTILAQLADAKADLAAQRASLDAKRAAVQQMKTQQERVVARVTALTSAAVAAEQQVAASAKAAAAALATIRNQKAAEQGRLAAAQAQSRALAKRIAAAAAAAARRGGLRARPSGGSLLWPAPGGLHGVVGPRTNPYTGNLSCHAGIDIGAGMGAPIRAAATGIVVATTYNAWDGNVAIIAHGGGMTTWYAHLSGFAVSEGQRVSRGQLVGYAGATGFATGPHLHFNVALNGVAYDPMGWFGGPMRTVGSLCHSPYPQPTL